jgi:hypothetical protein
MPETAGGKPDCPIPPRAPKRLGGVRGNSLSICDRSLAVALGGISVARGYFARLTFSQPLTLSLRSTVALSLRPEPQSTVSLTPFLALSVSFPAPPL